MDIEQICEILKIVILVAGCACALYALIKTIILMTADRRDYKKSQYYQDTNEKYTPGCSFVIQPYEAIKRERLPIIFYRNPSERGTGYGFYVYNDALIYEGEAEFDEASNKWVIRADNDECSDLQEAVNARIAECNASLKMQVCSSAAVIVDDELLKKHPDAEFGNIRLVPWDGEKIEDALRAVVESDF